MHRHICRWLFSTLVWLYMAMLVQMEISPQRKEVFFMSSSRGKTSVEWPLSEIVSDMKTAREVIMVGDHWFKEFLLNLNTKWMWYWCSSLNILCSLCTRICDQHRIITTRPKLNRFIVKNNIPCWCKTPSLATAHWLWPFMASSQTICFRFKHGWIYLPPFLHQSASLSRTHRSGSQESRISLPKSSPFLFIQQK